MLEECMKYGQSLFQLIAGYLPVVYNNNNYYM